MSSIYEDFVQQIKEESTPPEGAFTVKMFADDLGIDTERARGLIAKQVEKGRVKDAGCFPRLSGPGRACAWFVVVEDN